METRVKEKISTIYGANIVIKHFIMSFYMSMKKYIRMCKINIKKKMYLFFINKYIIEKYIIALHFLIIYHYTVDIFRIHFFITGNPTFYASKHVYYI